MARGNDRAYDDDYADPLEVPPEPIGLWGLSDRSRRWARAESEWGTSGERWFGPGGWAVTRAGWRQGAMAGARAVEAARLSVGCRLPSVAAQD